MTNEQLKRYGIKWQGLCLPICVEMDGGYWTPWHTARAEIERLRGELSSMRKAHDAAWALKNHQVDQLERQLRACHEPSERQILEMFCKLMQDREDGARPSMVDARLDHIWLQARDCLDRRAAEEAAEKSTEPTAKLEIVEECDECGDKLMLPPGVIIHCWTCRNGHYHPL